MKGQTVCSVLLIFLFTMAVLLLGLTLCEQGLQEINGWSGPAGAFALARTGPDFLTVTVAGHPYTFNLSFFRQILKYLRFPTSLLVSLRGTVL